MDFFMVSYKSTKRGSIEIYPKFIIKKSSDLMIRGGDFYAIWDQEEGLWSTDENKALQLIDKELDNYANENRKNFSSDVKVLHMWDAETGMIDNWHKYCQRQMRDNYIPLDEKIIFSNDTLEKTAYASKRLDYPLINGSYSGYDKLISTLYSPEERHKIEWAIGSIITGESKRLQKFMVLYGSAGAGKSTILNIIQDLFKGYYSVFDAKALGSSSNSFALEAFKSNPLVAIQHDGDLSRIEDNTRLNSLVSHELMTVNEKFKSTYSNAFKAFLFMGTNKPVRITDAKSGLIRRLIDVEPSGNKLPVKEYNDIMRNIKFELSGIAWHCKEVFEENPNYYDNYIPINMMGASNDFYNFILDAYYVYLKDDSTTLKASWEMYKNYCTDSNVPYPLSQRAFKEELKNYFNEFNERDSVDGVRVRNYYSGFKKDIFIEHKPDKESNKKTGYVIDFQEGIESIFDKDFADCQAQLANEDEHPKYKWDNVKTKLSSIDTKELHYVKVPLNHIVIDFDITDENGNKSFEKNLEAASKWPPTYSELSKSGSGIHLHYNYTGDVSKLSRMYDQHIEIKIFNGNSSLRRKLSKCNNLPINEISSGLPIKKGDKKVVSNDIIKNEKMLRAMIKKNLNKEIHPGTKPSVDFIFKLLEDSYSAGFIYDVSDMRKSIFAFAANSTHQSEYCMKLVNKMKFKSEKEGEHVQSKEKEIIFFDIEVFPNLFLVNWKKRGDNPVIRMINPKPAEIEELINYRLIGFNNRSYDNHMLYGCMMGYNNKQLYNLSQRIISGDRNAKFGEAYNLSYTDVYDFASAVNKMSLKKFEIKLGIKHHELGLPWDQPVPEEKWVEVAEYCDDDVLATEKVFDYLESDWTARKILAKMSGKSVNDSTNSLSTAIVFGNNKNPQNEFNYRDLSKPVAYPEILESDNIDFFGDKRPFNSLNIGMYDFLTKFDILSMKFVAWNGEKSVLPCFPGYEYKYGKSTYRGVEVGEGGYVYAEPGIHENVALLDIASMHPTSVISECLFGPKYTERFRDLKEARVAIKHNDMDSIRTMLDGMLYEVLNEGTYSTKVLGTALKTPINSVYGLTSAKFKNAFRDERNKDNIVAKRGALFMVDLMYEVQARGFTVAHIKTDSIKIPNATPEIINFVMEFGKLYGYTFEHEATYEKMCLVNNAVYIAKFANPEWCKKTYNYVPDECTEAYESGDIWTATGTQFAVPYVFKKLFSHEDIIFEDMCETKQVSSAMYLNKNKNISQEELTADKMIFIGKVGNFCPMLPGKGGDLLRQSVDKEGNYKYDNVTGAKGYEWLESDMVKELGLEEFIDESYYKTLVDKAVEAIEKYGDFEQFAN